MSLESINPTTGKLIRRYTEMDEAGVERALNQADRAFQEWRRVPIAQRAAASKRVAQALRQRKEEFARLMAEEMGKPLSQGESETEKCAWVCDYYAETAEEFLAPEIVATDAGKSFVSYQPLGVLLAIMPWNFPFWQAFRAATPALMAGNAVLLKHASNVSGCALAIEDLFRSAGTPDGLFRTLLVGSNRVSRLIGHPAVKAVTLTGSTAAGESVAAAAGKLLKKTVLELGGSDPYIVLPDAEIDKTVEACVASRLINSGQSCIAAKRFIVVASVLAEFQERFVEKMRIQKMGDPTVEGVKVGPLARLDLREQLHEQVRKSLQQGAKLILGGEIPEGPGAFYPPTALTDVKKGMPAFDEETFGPVAAIISAGDETEAIQLANDSPFGLGAAVFTRDKERGERIAAEELQAGCCFVNDFVKSDPRLPFGGIKRSGYGRELSHFGLREFVNIKTVCVR